MTEVYRDSLKKLKQAGIEDAEGQLMLLIAHHTGLAYTEIRRRLLLCPSFPDVFFEVEDKDQAEKIGRDVDALLEGEPLQYLTGETDFYGMPFYTARDVLIPRFDTECVLETVLSFLTNRSRLLDLCCGSGCIGIAAAALTGAEVFLADVSEKALALTQRNADRHGVKAHVFHHDLFCDEENGLYDVIVSNPPYIPTADLATLSAQVKKEPSLALDGGADGLVFYRKITEKYRKNLAKDGWLVFEIGIGQSDDVCAILKEHGYRDVGVKKDLNGIDRAVFAKRPETT